jgi:hypothetical protein
VGVVQLGPPFSTVGRHQQRAGVAADSQPYAAQPVLDLVLLLALAGIPRHHVQGAAGEEELMRDPVDLLTPEVPSSHSQVTAG